MEKTLVTGIVVAAALLAIGVVSSVEYTAIQVSAASMMSGNQTGDGNMTGGNMPSQSTLASAVKDLTIAIKDLKAGNIKGAMMEMNMTEHIVGRPSTFRWWQRVKTKLLDYKIRHWAKRNIILDKSREPKNIAQSAQF